MKTIKKLGLKRETVRTLKVRAGIQTGGFVMNTVVQSLSATKPVDTLICPTPNPNNTANSTFSSGIGGGVSGPHAPPVPVAG